MNNICITGHLGQHPELRYTATEKAVCTISFANNTGWGDHKRSCWFTAKCWGKHAEFVNEYGAKGRLVLVTGEMVYNEDDNGKRWYEIANARVEFPVKDQPKDPNQWDEDEIPF